MYYYLLHNVLLNSTLYVKRSSNYIAWNMINGKLIWGYVLYIKKDWPIKVYNRKTIKLYYTLPRGKNMESLIALLSAFEPKDFVLIFFYRFINITYFQLEVITLSNILIKI